MARTRSIQTCAMDRLSSLPDTCLSIILSKLSLRELARCSLLSRRWRHILGRCHFLRLSPSSLLSHSSLVRPDSIIAAAESAINDLLFFHSSPVQSFAISYNVSAEGSSTTSTCFSTENIWRWVRWAASKNVQELTLKDNAQCHCGDHPQNLPSSLYSCRELKSLHIEFYSFLQQNPYSHGFQFLTECKLVTVKLSDESFERFISHCPQLRSLNIESSYGLDSPTVSSPNLKHLCLTLVNRAVDLTAKCPLLINIVLGNFQGAKINNLPALFLYGGFMKAAVNGNDLKIFELDYTSSCDYHSICFLWIMEDISTFTTLNRLILRGGDDLYMEEGKFVNFLTKLPKLEHLSLCGSFVTHLAASPIPLRLASPLENLIKVHLELHHVSVNLLVNCILGSSPKLQIMKVTLPRTCDLESKMKFLEALLGMKRASAEARIIIT